MNNRFLEKTDPTIKAVVILILAIALSFTSSTALNLSVYVISMLLIAAGTDKIIKALKFSLITCAPAAGYMVTGMLFGTGRESGMASVSVSTISAGLLLATRLFAFIGLGMVFSLSTCPYKFTESLKTRAHLPRKFACGILCAFNLLPVIREEYKNARLALSVRGVKTGFFSAKPLFSMLVNSVRWSEALSLAMKSKGFNDED